MTDREAAAPGPLALHTEWQAFLPRWDIILSDDGIAWRRKGQATGHWVTWEMIGGVSIGVEGEKTPTTKILALDGSPFGSIQGLFAIDGEATNLAHVVALHRPDLFVEVDGSPWSGGCIRREVAAAETASARERDEPA